MLRLQTIKHLADRVALDVGELKLTAEFVNRDVSEWTAWDPSKKERPVIAVSGKLRAFQDRFYNRVLRVCLHPSPHSFGCIAGRHVIHNVTPHIGSRFVFKTDLSGFYPSISIDRVNRLFLKQLGCSYEVSRILTRLCTFDFHLALGLVTSPILADQVLHAVDLRIAALCEQYQLTYTRFVDDITVSGDYDIEQSPVPRALASIVESHGFKLKQAKSIFGEIKRGIQITGLQIKNDRVDVAASYLAEVERQIEDHISLGNGGPFYGPFVSSSQLTGRVNYICWVNRNRRFKLMRKYRTIKWSQVWDNAKRRGLIHAKKELRRRGEPGPDYSRCFQHDPKFNGQPTIVDAPELQQDLCPFQ